MKTCPTCGKEFVALPEDLGKLGNEWLELKLEETEIAGRLELLKRQIISIMKRANKSTVKGAGWRATSKFSLTQKVMCTRLTNQGVEQDIIKYAIEQTIKAKRQRLEDKGVSADILDYTFNRTGRDSEDRVWAVARSK